MSGYAFANVNSPAPDFLRMALEWGSTLSAQAVHARKHADADQRVPGQGPAAFRQRGPGPVTAAPFADSTDRATLETEEYFRT
jgi:hypothetical protein